MKAEDKAVGDTITALSAAYGQVKRLQSVDSALADQALASRLGTTARNAARQRYSVTAMIQRYEELWRRLAA